MNSASLLLCTGVLFIVTVIFGFWLSHLGKPYHQILFNVHKLIALAVVVLVGLEFSKLLKSGNVESKIILLVIFFAVMVISLFASGAIMSLDKLNFTMLRWIHRIAPIVMVGLGVWVFVLF